MATANQKIEKKSSDKDQKQKIRLKIKSYDHKIIDEVLKTIIEVIHKSGSTIIGPVPLPTEIKKFTVNRSTFVHKDSRDQYEMRVHKRLLDIIDINSKTIEALTTLNLPGGVDVEIKM
ncbi:MAG: 30S ribosomal protein S10 [Parcubacteria group bacterium]|nr:30S ribosomal protein S10 [Parcubacteria group bacterium]